MNPSNNPSLTPSRLPSASPSNIHTVLPSILPSRIPSSAPTLNPSITPSALPISPTKSPSSYPTILPSSIPSTSPSLNPFIQPSGNIYANSGTYPWIAPAGYATISVKLWGAGGAGGSFFPTYPGQSFGGGSGGFSICQLSVTPGQSLTMIIGGGGLCNAGYGNSNAGGYGGGGIGKTSDGYWAIGSGGGRSAIRLSGTSDAVTAGGGGGGGGFQTGSSLGETSDGGGGGGGLTGGISNAATSSGFIVAGGGGNQTHGGAGGYGNGNGSTGQQYQGGDGSSWGGGGGGGYYGGGGGGFTNGHVAAGGGGSGYIGGCVAGTGQTYSGTISTSSGITPPANYNDASYIFGAGVGGSAGGGGGNGLIVITLTSCQAGYYQSDASTCTLTTSPSALPTSPSTSPSMIHIISPSMIPSIVPSTIRIAQTVITHRYSFNSGDCKDSVGGQSCTSLGVTFSGGLATMNGNTLSPASGPYIQLASNIIPSGTAFTVEMWVILGANNYGDASTKGFARLFQFGQYASLPGGNNPSISVNRQQGTPNIMYSEWSATSTLINQYNLASLPSPFNGVEAHVVYVHDYPAGIATLYVNGVSNSITTTLADFQYLYNYLGKSIDTNQYGLSGSFDEVRIWNGALSSAQVLTNYGLGPSAVSYSPSQSPTTKPSAQPSITSSNLPSRIPSVFPTTTPTLSPTCRANLCSAGQFMNEPQTCSQCTAGQYTSRADQSACSLCPPGKYNNLESPGSTSSCSPCPAGSYANFVMGATACIPCLSGKYAYIGVTSCTLCSAGQYSPSQGLSVCMPCLPGTYSSSGATSCHSCPAHTTSSGFAYNCSSVC